MNNKEKVKAIYDLPMDEPKPFRGLRADLLLYEDTVNERVNDYIRQTLVPQEYTGSANATPTSTKADIDPHAEIKISMSNEDIMMGDYTVCPKDVMIKAWMDKVGQYIDFMDVKKKVLEVEVTPNFIFITLK